MSQNTAVTRTDSERAELLSLVLSAPAGELPPEARALIVQRKVMNRVATEIANLSWGKGMDLPTRAALAEYGRATGVDVLTEIDILGGKLYRNATYYLNRAAPLIHAGVIAEMGGRYINLDPRLKAIAEGGSRHAARARDEYEDREYLLATHNVPANAASVYLAHVVLRDGQRFEAAAWCGGGSRKSDPIGDAEPTKTSQTRALRRALRLVVPSVPQLRAIVERDEDAAVEIGEVLSARRDAVRLARAEATEDQRALPAGLHGVRPLVRDGYGGDDIPAAVAVAEQHRHADPYQIGEPGAVDTDSLTDAELAEMDLDDRRPAARTRNPMAEGL